MYNLDPLKPNFYKVKFVFVFLSFLLKNIDCGTR